MRTMGLASTQKRKCPGSITPACTGRPESRRSRDLDRGEGKGVGRRRSWRVGVPRRDAWGAIRGASAGATRVGEAGVTNRLDAKEVVHLTFESTGE